MSDCTVIKKCFANLTLFFVRRIHAVLAICLLVAMIALCIALIRSRRNQAPPRINDNTESGPLLDDDPNEQSMHRSNRQSTSPRNSLEGSSSSVSPPRRSALVNTKLLPTSNVLIIN